MEKELLDEIDYEIELLIKSGFYNDEDILEIIEDEFIDEEINIDLISRISNKSSKIFSDMKTSDDFLRLKQSFNELIRENNIICIHNAGYDIEEGIQDSFEVYTHLINNKFAPEGFCFYSFEDVEIAIYENTLNISFGDFEYDESKGLEIARIIANTLENNGFKIKWNETIDEQIQIEEFIWQKVFDNEEYSMDGAFNDFVAISKGDIK